jgi:hypothetical protein
VYGHGVGRGAPGLDAVRVPVPHARRTSVTRVAHPFDTGRVRYGKDECEHGMPGGTPATCALCRIAQPDQLELDVVDVRALAAGER